MSFLPGVGANLMDKVNEKDAIAKMKKFLVIMDSMTNAELDNKVSLLVDAKTRITRIARGAGADEEEIKFLLFEYSRLKKMLNGFSKSKLGKGK
jgi:signal recognition particle subunit SRP54